MFIRERTRKDIHTSREIEIMDTLSISTTVGKFLKSKGIKDSQ